MDWLSIIAADIAIESLPREYQVVAEIIGMENALKLAQHIGGGRIYYPKIESLMRDARDARIRAEFTGGNHRDLARKYSLTETWIREIVQRKPADVTADLFDETEDKL